MTSRSVGSFASPETPLYHHSPSAPRAIVVIGCRITLYRLAAFLSNLRLVSTQGSSTSPFPPIAHACGNKSILLAGLFIRCRSPNSMTALHTSAWLFTSCVYASLLQSIDFGPEDRYAWSSPYAFKLAPTGRAALAFGFVGGGGGTGDAIGEGTCGLMTAWRSDTVCC